MSPPHSHVQDVLLALGLLLIFSLPLAYLFPSTFNSFFQLFVSLWRTILWLGFTLVVLVIVGGTALVGEKAYKRFVLGQAPSTTDDSIGRVAPGASQDEMRRARRVTRETRMEQAAEKVVDKLEATGVGKLFRRRPHTGAGTPSRKGKEKAVNQDDVELDELRGRGTSSGISRAPALPPR
ncbi:uncharacterized protein JCM15063_003829 [Sporobolomyces koalae]|uniref:uncharacterized protein n=1 Tax=Sporobolomyces koalae TaxID=500713 RepID=UPI00317C9B92